MDDTGEAGRVREACRSMASRLSELDPMHSRFYEFVERGGSVWGAGKAPVGRREDVGVEADSCIS